MAKRTSAKSARAKSTIVEGPRSLRPGRHGFDPAADLVLEAITAQGWSVSELAARSGVGREAISYWLHGHRSLRADYLLAIMEVLGWSITPRRA